MTTDVENLQTLWHSNFPLSKAMGLTVVSYQQHRLVTRSPLELNTNIHNTAFAGSLYTQLAMTAWGLLHLEIVTAGLDASIIHADGKIDFHSTLETDIYAAGDFSDLSQHVQELQTKGKTRLNMTCVAGSDPDITEPSSSFSGTYLARLAQ